MNEELGRIRSVVDELSSAAFYKPSFGWIALVLVCTFVLYKLVKFVNRAARAPWAPEDAEMYYDTFGRAPPGHVLVPNASGVGDGAGAENQNEDDQEEDLNGDWTGEIDEGYDPATEDNGEYQQMIAENSKKINEDNDNDDDDDNGTKSDGKSKKRHPKKT